MNKQELVRHLRDGNADGHITQNVDATEDMLKWSVDELIGTHLEQHGGRHKLEQSHSAEINKVGINSFYGKRRNFWSY